MHKLYLIVALALSLTSCDTITKKRLPGIYQYVGQKQAFQTLDKFELTDTKFIANTFAGETALDYDMEGNYLYVNSAGIKYCLKIVSLDTLRADVHSPFAGTYVKAK